MRKKDVTKFKVKLVRLKELEKSRVYKYQVLNDFSKFLNQSLQDLKIDSIAPVRILGEGNSALGAGPSHTETSILHELINKYSEILTEIDHNHGISIIHEFKETSGRLKAIASVFNLALLLGCANLFYGLGKDAGMSIESKKKNSSQVLESNLNGEVQVPDPQLNKDSNEVMPDSVENSNIAR